ncbi:hypothetical protein Hdeb2414_s0007g00235411 [Helianthus debilis subsp. tardiflorus]
MRKETEKARAERFLLLKCLKEHSMELYPQPQSPSLIPSLCEMISLLHLFTNMRSLNFHHVLFDKNIYEYV